MASRSPPPSNLDPTQPMQAPQGADAQRAALDHLWSLVHGELRRAAHGKLRITLHDGSEREIEITAFPLFAHHDEFVGAVAIFWDSNGKAS